MRIIPYGSGSLWWAFGALVIQYCQLMIIPKPSEFSVEEESKARRYRPIVGAGAVYYLGCGAWRRNKKQAADIRLSHYLVPPPDVRHSPYTHLSPVGPRLLT